MASPGGDDHVSLSSLRPPSPLVLDEALLGPQDPSARPRVLTAVAKANAIEIKRKNFNHVKNKLKIKQAAFFALRQEFHNGGHQVDEFPAVRSAYTTFETSSREYHTASLEYLSLVDQPQKDDLRRTFGLELAELNRQLRTAYEFMKDDRDEQRTRITIAADVHIDPPPPPINPMSAAAATTSQVPSVEDPDAITVDKPSVVVPSSSAENLNPRPPSKSGSAGSKSRSSGTGSGSMSSSTRRRLAQQRARLELEHAKKKAQLREQELEASREAKQ